MNGRAALDFGLSPKKKEFIKMFNLYDETCFWAWRRMRDRIEEENTAPAWDRISDKELIDVMVSTIMPRHPSKGDGRFNRVVTYISNVCDTIDWLKTKWTGNNEILNAFMLGIDATCQALRAEIRLIDQKPVEWQDRNWNTIDERLPYEDTIERMKEERDE